MQNQAGGAAPEAPSIWKRALYMLLFAIIYSVAEVVIYAVVIFQFFAVLITGRSNEQLLAFGQSLSTFVYQIMRFLTFNSEQRPFPIGSWPADTAMVERVEEDTAGEA